MEEPRREQIQRLYIRVCRDSGFRFDAIQAAHFAGALLGITAVDVWLTMDLDTMVRIAEGKHPCLELKRYRT